MSGHSKWATTKHKKAVVDARRGKLFAKLIKNVEVAARMGGGDSAGNPTLYDAIQKAKKSSVPNNNIDNAVKRGSGLEAGGRQDCTLQAHCQPDSRSALHLSLATQARAHIHTNINTKTTPPLRRLSPSSTQSGRLATLKTPPTPTQQLPDLTAAAVAI